MSDFERNDINTRLAEVAKSFGLKVKLTVHTAQNLIEENYKKIREIDLRIKSRLNAINLA